MEPTRTLPPVKQMAGHDTCRLTYYLYPNDIHKLWFTRGTIVQGRFVSYSSQSYGITFTGTASAVENNTYTVNVSDFSSVGSQGYTATARGTCTVTLQGEYATHIYCEARDNVTPDYTWVAEMRNIRF